MTVDDRQVGGRVVELPPGPYAIDWDPAARRGVMCGSSTLTSCKAASPGVELFAGRHYRLSKSGWFSGPQPGILLLEDADSRETLSCVVAAR